MKTNKKHTPEEKAAAVALALSIGSVKAGKQLGIADGRIRHWVIDSMAEKAIASQPVIPECNPSLEFMAEYLATDGDIILAASRCGIDIKEAGKLVIGYLKTMESEYAIKKKNPPQKMAGKLPSHIKTRKGSMHMVIPDVQAKPGQDFDFLRKIGLQVAKKKPDVLVCIGDFSDLPSLSSYDRGKLSSHGKAYAADVKATKLAMSILMAPIQAAMAMDPTWKPVLVLTLGNHEHRINRTVDEIPTLDGFMSTDDLGYADFGWMVYPFLEVVNIDGINYSHYITTGVMGRPAASARAMITKKHQSCVMGHVQKDEIATEYTFDNKLITGVFVGCCYESDEDYLGPQGNFYFRGIWQFYEVDDGAFHPIKVPLSFIHKKWK